MQNPMTPIGAFRAAGSLSTTAEQRLEVALDHVVGRAHEDAEELLLRGLGLGAGSAQLRDVGDEPRLLAVVPVVGDDVVPRVGEEPHRLLRALVETGAVMEVHDHRERTIPVGTADEGAHLAVGCRHGKHLIGHRKPPGGRGRPDRNTALAGAIPSSGGVVAQHAQRRRRVRAAGGESRFLGRQALRADATERAGLAR